jgi:hypothetical protein
MGGIEFDRQNTGEWLGEFVLNYYRSGERHRLGEALGYAAGLYGDRLATPQPANDAMAGYLALSISSRGWRGST